MQLEIVSVLAQGMVMESLLARAGDRLVVLERTHEPDDTWNVVTDESLARTRAVFDEQRRYLALVDHPAILAAYETEIAGGRVQVVKEYADGPKLEIWAEAQPPAAILAMCVAAGRVFSACHAVGLCQVPPSAGRIFVVDGQPRVHAFGALRAFGAYDELGPPWHRAPEAYEGPLDALTDQWGFASMVWSLLYGVPPVMRDSYMMMWDATRRGERDEPPPRAVPPAVRAALERAMTVDRTRRFGSFDELLDALC